MQIMRNMSSIGLDLRRWVDAGLLHFHATRPTSAGLEVHLAIMIKLIRKLHPSKVIVDPISNLTSMGSCPAVKSMLVQLIDVLKTGQITGCFTCLTTGDTRSEANIIEISSLMDTWLLLRDFETNGERNRGLYIMKSRGLAHSKQVREFLLTDHGVELVDVYSGPVACTWARRGSSKTSGSRPRWRHTRKKPSAPSASKTGSTRPGGQNRRLAGGGGRGTNRAHRARARTNRAHAGAVIGSSCHGFTAHRGRGARSSQSGGRRERFRVSQSQPQSTPDASTSAESFVLRLYVAGQTPKSITAFRNLKRICEEYLAGQFQIEVIDLLENPMLAAGDQILAIPTLVRRLPQPMMRIIGDLSNTERVLVGLDLRPYPLAAARE